MDTYKLSNEIYGTLKKPFNINYKTKILIFCGKQDDITGNKLFIYQRISKNVILYEFQNSKHYEQTDKEYLEYENFISKYL
jgi:hypothetical protein